MLLTWKMSLLAYCRGDGKAVDKFADLFRALRCFYSAPSARTGSVGASTT